MNVIILIILIILLLTPAGPRIERIEAPGRLQCERTAFDLRHGSIPVTLPQGTRIVDAYCVQEYET